MSDSPALKVVPPPPPESGAETNEKPQGTSAGTSVGSSSTPTMTYLLHALKKYKASDLHLKAGRPPMFRVNGKLVAAKMRELTGKDIESIIFSVLTDAQIHELTNKLQVDAGFKIENLGRFRLNAYHQRGTVAGVIRMIPLTVPDLDSLGMPAVLKEIAMKKRGLILITGSTGSGKSTTMAAMVAHINSTTHSHIITIEDPIEFVHQDIRSSVSQREIGPDTTDVNQALMGALRQDPDVIMLGELRRKETIETALTAAETGHLVLSTLHTTDASSSLDRIIDVFPADAQNQVRVSLASSLCAVISQRLVPRADGRGRVAACEILIKSRTIEDYIMNNELDKIDEAIAQSSSFYKMQTFNQHLEALVEQGVILQEDALLASNKPDELKMRLQGLRKEEGF